MRSLVSLVAAVVLSSTVLSACATGAADDEYASTEDEAATAGKFALFQAADGGWQFHLKSGNGAVLLQSDAYTSRTGAINGILSVQTNGVDAAQYRIVPAASGFVLHLVAANHKVISTSEVHATKSSATRAITSCVRATTSYLDRREAGSTGARVEVLANETGKFRFTFFAQSGQTVLSSESYETEAAAFNGAYVVQTEGQNAASYSLNEISGGFYFTVRARNNQVVGTSQAYPTKAAADAAMVALQKLLPTISVL
ncbi:MAG: YegP family protein [Deltaproteobacteria bacterium]|nr:YegP family protein [Deltaproteobacteria bacterium]MCW5803327.1 YegP family protein [Deltaproteobacteria bacterium]